MIWIYQNFPAMGSFNKSKFLQEAVRNYCVSVRWMLKNCNSPNIKGGSYKKGEWLRNSLQKLPPIIPTINTKARESFNWYIIKAKSNCWPLLDVKARTVTHSRPILNCSLWSDNWKTSHQLFKVTVMEPQWRVCGRFGRMMNFAGVVYLFTRQTREHIMTCDPDMSGH